MRLLSLMILAIALISCSTTMQRSHAPYATVHERPGKDPVLGAILGALIGQSGAAVGAAAFGMLDAYDRPTREYENIAPTELYTFILNTLRANSFEVLKSDKGIGTIVAKFDRGTVKQFWLWQWTQCYYAIFDLRGDLSGRPTVRLYYTFMAEELPPLSQDFVSIKLPLDALETRHTLLSKIDEYVTISGGRY